MHKNILITGGTGTIGISVSELLTNRGHRVRILSRSAHDKADSYDYFTWDPVIGKMEDAAFKNVDVVIHLAGESIAGKKWTKTRKKLLTDSRVNTAKFIKDVISGMDEKPEVLISASGTGYYGYDTGSVVMKENSRFGDDFLATLVKKWETVADSFEELGMRVVKFRTGLVLSKYGGALEVMTRPVKMGIGSPLGRGDQIISWIHADDLAAMYGYAVENTALKGVYNAVSPEPVTNTNFMKTTAKVLKRPFFMPNVPSFVLKMMLGEMASLVTGGNYVSSEKICNEGFDFNYNHLEEALENLLLS